MPLAPVSNGCSQPEKPAPKWLVPIRSLRLTHVTFKESKPLCRGTSKISAIVAAAVVLASASVASAQTVYAPYANSYYNNQDTRNLRYGHANDHQFDPYAGTVFQGVAP